MVELRGHCGRFRGVLAQQQPGAEIGAPDPPAGIDARSQHEAEMPRLRRPGEPRGIDQRREPDPLAPPHRDQPLGDEGAVEADERHHVGDGAERDEIDEVEQVRLGPRRIPEAAPAQLAIDRDDGQEHEADGGEMAERGEIVVAVRIDDRRLGQLLVGLVMVDDDGVEAEPRGLRERLEARRAAVDGDEELRAALGEPTDRLDVRPVALEDAVGNMEQRIEAAAAQEAREQRRRGRAVDVIVAEDGDGLAALHRIGDPGRRHRHVGEDVRVRHQALEGRVEIAADRIRLDLAPGDDAGEQLRHPVALHDRERARIAALVEPVTPRAPGHGAFDAEEVAMQQGDGHRALLACTASVSADGWFTIRNCIRCAASRCTDATAVHCQHDAEQVE